MDKIQTLADITFISTVPFNKWMTINGERVFVISFSWDGLNLWAEYPEGQWSAKKKCTINK